ncbi:MAG: dihydrodipicolinate synthase family protein [Atopobiaceae bacterium]|jgi:4-hydroxy-tetrahydrodipicolinate synthase|nr:dihydrodipicolinate synthase family protein [Atopobiaceae bacterium]MCH4180775.1 dihydrodipicolinate synthase family protein [Atopobiaceae bacterium]MCH4214460.1 dihydrodipicolinate synthase family protein [Atopobiaceae bacterium]MCH4229390.1 dihydrodipicolinate synthase family protein [Atopobiaceae bacterium]MCH4276652.1 dihydrodipicolinate synthase family protein [Atopobiaceae bacterium]
MAQSFKISGVVPPVVMPLTQDRELDVEAFERHIERLISAGVNGLFFLGSSGEVAFSDDERRAQVIKEALRIVDHRVPVLAGCIDTETQRVIRHADAMTELGVDAIVVTAPFYALPGPHDVENHFRAIHEHVDTPMFAYDIPVCVHQKLDTDMLVRLGRDGVLAGVKDSSADDIAFRYLCIYNREAGHPLSVLTGHEIVVDGAYLSGADGSVPGLANIDPYGYVRQWKAYQAGDWKQVAAEQDRLAKLMSITSVTKGVGGFGAGVGAFKTALREMGIFPTNQMSLPVEALEGENVKAIRVVLRKAGLIN